VRSLPLAPKSKTDGSADVTRRLEAESPEEERPIEFEAKAIPLRTSSKERLTSTTNSPQKRSVSFNMEVDDDESFTAREPPKLERGKSTRSDFSATSWSDFNRRNNGKADASLRENPPGDQPDGPFKTVSTGDIMRTISTQAEVGGATGPLRGGLSSLQSSESALKALVLELDLPESMSSGGSGDGGSAEFIRRHSKDTTGSQSEVLDSDITSGCSGGATDAKLAIADGKYGETVNAEVVDLGKGQNGQNRVRIAFKSNLRTQNQWQKQLLEQQETLLQSMKAELEATRQALVARDEVRDETRDLLRGFRKIVTRNMTGAQLENSKVVIFVLEERDEIRNELTELCDFLEYDCQAFKTLDEGLKAVRKVLLSDVVVDKELEEAQATGFEASKLKNPMSYGSTGSTSTAVDETTKAASRWKKAANFAKKGSGFASAVRTGQRQKRRSCLPVWCSSVP